MAFVDAAGSQALRGGGGASAGDSHDGAPELQVPTPAAQAVQAAGHAAGWQGAERELTQSGHRWIQIEPKAGHAPTGHRLL